MTKGGPKNSTIIGVGLDNREDWFRIERIEYCQEKRHLSAITRGRDGETRLLLAVVHAQPLGPTMTVRLTVVRNVGQEIVTAFIAKLNADAPGPGRFGPTILDASCGSMLVFTRQGAPPRTDVPADRSSWEDLTPVEPLRADT